MANNIEAKGKSGKSKSLIGRMSRKAKIWLIIAFVVLAVVLYVVISGARASANAASSYQTTTIERGPLTATIGATGNVRASQTAIINWQTSGTVETVNVSVGDRVLARDVLAFLSTTSLAQNVVLAQADLVTAKRNLDSVLHSSTQRAQAQLNLVNAQQTYNKAKATLDMLIAQSHGAATADVQNLQAKVTIAQNQLNQAQNAYNALSDLPDDDARKAQAYTTLYNARQSLAAAQANLNGLQGPSTTNIQKAQADMDLAQAQLEDAQREWTRLKDGPDPSDVAAAQARVDAAQATINFSRLMTPFAGTVTVADPMVGDQVSTSTSGFRVDDLSRLLVDVQVSEVDINSVAVDQPALVTFDAVTGREYHGKVVDVSRVGTSVQSVVNFSVTVELTDPDADVKPGMTASVTITIQSLENVLLVPNRGVHLVNSQRVVYVLRNGQLLEIPVTLGASDDTMSEVTSGDLSAGDVLVLNPPANFTPGQGGGPGRMFGGG
ncbi:MAG: efflux RND transporter periplasmic adaptor subunit [Anaerolineales bacterium]|nr:efflux RND transporter periplasmic adaptor subunit [Anaerolineales bacterium]